jgi:hypothetical protein
MHDLAIDKMALVQILVNMIQYNSNARLKPTLIDQMLDLIEFVEPQALKSVLPTAYKLLEDNNGQIKLKTEKLVRKLYQSGIPIIDNCPQSKLQRVVDICHGDKKVTNGTGSSGKNSSGYGTGKFGANGNSVHLNMRN